MYSRKAGSVFGAWFVSTLFCVILEKIIVFWHVILIQNFKQNIRCSPELNCLTNNKGKCHLMIQFWKSIHHASSYNKRVCLQGTMQCFAEILKPVLMSYFAYQTFPTGQWVPLWMLMCLYCLGICMVQYWGMQMDLQIQNEAIITETMSPASRRNVFNNCTCWETNIQVYPLYSSFHIHSTGTLCCSTFSIFTSYPLQPPSQVSKYVQWANLQNIPAISWQILKYSCFNPTPCTPRLPTSARNHLLVQFCS